LRATNDLDSIYVINNKVRKVKQSGETLVDRNPIQEHLRVFAPQSPSENRCELTRRAGLRHRYTGNFPQRICDATRLFDFEVLRPDHSHTRRRFPLGRLDTRGTDDDFSGFRFRIRKR
jgi:hypothetical protein